MPKGISQLDVLRDRNPVEYTERLAEIVPDWPTCDGRRIVPTNVEYRQRRGDRELHTLSGTRPSMGLVWNQLGTTPCARCCARCASVNVPCGPTSIETGVGLRK